MKRDQLLLVLREKHGEMEQCFNVKHLALFGSMARDEARENSDVDILVEFNGPTTYLGYFGLKDYLEQLLGRSVDLVTEKGLKPRARPHVERDLIRVA